MPKQRADPKRWKATRGRRLESTAVGSLESAPNPSATTNPDAQHATRTPARTTPTTKPRRSTPKRRSIHTPMEGLQPASQRRSKRTNSPGCSRRSKILSAAPPSPAANRRNKIHPAALPSPTTSGRKPGRAGESTAAIRTRTGTTAPLLRQTLDLDTTTSSLYTSAQQFCGPPPSPTPDRPSERRGAGGIAAGSSFRLGVALFSPLYSR